MVAEPSIRRTAFLRGSHFNRAVTVGRLVAADEVFPPLAAVPAVLDGNSAGCAGIGSCQSSARRPRSGSQDPATIDRLARRADVISIAVGGRQRTAQSIVCPGAPEL